MAEPARNRPEPPEPPGTPRNLPGTYPQIYAVLFYFNSAVKTEGNGHNDNAWKKSGKEKVSAGSPFVEA